MILKKLLLKEYATLCYKKLNHAIYLIKYFALSLYPVYSWLIQFLKSLFYTVSNFQCYWTTEWNEILWLFLDAIAYAEICPISGNFLNFYVQGTKWEMGRISA